MLFLLGGYDLEMLTIKELLKQNNIKFIDKNLSWGAKLSEYQDELNFDGTIYGVELEEDITPPKNYKSIDHHNKNSHLPSSLEQVAHILNIKLNRHQQLVSANDTNHIKGMQNLNATYEEIQTIRELDRKAQGVTDKDEELAKKSIKDLNIIYSKTPHFSAICDRVYDKFNNYIVYNDKKIVFYGYKVKDILKYLDTKHIKKDDYYYGGGEFGFVGIAEDKLSKENILNLIEEFNIKEIISYHTFMLPFIFELEDKKEIVSKFEFKPYKDEYNELAYFHKFFKSSMFSKDENENSSFYQFKEKDIPFSISKSKEYKLNLKSVNLRMFKTGVGILSFHIENDTYQDEKDILEINDFGRRIYPEYLDETLKCNLVPNYIEVDGVKEDFHYTKRPTKITLSKIITHFLPKEKIEVAVDDRMFVISFYKNETFAEKLKDDFMSYDKWYEYIYIDGDGITVQNDEMKQELIQKATYPRWQNYKTMYGISKYSFVCLSSSDFTLSHIKTMYFQMFSLLLMVRATILKFSNEVSDIANNIDKKETTDKVNDLYKRYIQFVNNFYFREVTAKDQGLEIYEKALDILNIQRDIKDLDAEIDELHKFVEIKQKKEAEIEAEKTNKKLTDISLYGGILLLASFFTGFFGMNVGSDENFSGYFVYPSILVSIYFGYKYIKREKR